MPPQPSGIVRHATRRWRKKERFRLGARSSFHWGITFRVSSGKSVTNNAGVSPHATVLLGVALELLRTLDASPDLLPSPGLFLSVLQTSLRDYGPAFPPGVLAPRDLFAACGHPLPLLGPVLEAVGLNTSTRQTTKSRRRSARRVPVQSVFPVRSLRPPPPRSLSPRPEAYLHDGGFGVVRSQPFFFSVICPCGAPPDGPHIWGP